MILVGDLGFLCSLVVVVLGWFVRRKWRRLVARREEIRRLMILASEETARAEQEAADGYITYGSVQAPAVGRAEEMEPVPVVAAGSPHVRQVQHHCEVCFSPTTTRCKQCKAVRYCSRKCQVIHWREGHKDECLSLQLRSKEFKEDEIAICQNVVETDLIDAAKPVESHSGEHLVTGPVSHALNENKDDSTQIRDDLKKTSKRSHLSFSVDSLQSTHSGNVVFPPDSNLKDFNRDDGKSPDVNVESMKPLLSKQANLVKPENGVVASSNSNQLKSGCIDIDEMSESSTSSDSGATGSEEHVFPRPSKPLSPDFWGGSVKPVGSKISALDETLSSKTNGVIKDDSCPSTSILNRSRKLLELSEDDSLCLQSSGRVTVNVETLDSDTITVTRNDPCPFTSAPNKSAQSSKSNDHDLESTEPLVSSHKLPGQDTVDKTGNGHSSSEEAKLAIPSAGRRHVLGKPDVSNLQSLTPPKQLNHGADGRNGHLDAVKVNNSSSLRASEARSSSSSCTTKSIPDAQDAEDEFIRVDAAFDPCSSCYLQNAKSGTTASARGVVGQLRSSNFIRNGPFSVENGIKAQHEDGSFSYELFVKLYNWNKIELYPCGLVNCGNSCFANSVLQCLAFTPPLTAYFLQGLHSETCKTKVWCFTCELEVLVKKAKEGNSPLSPARIMSQMERIGPQLAPGREEDAHEFLRYAIETMQLVYPKETEVDIPSSVTTLLGLTFGGYLQSKIECMGCGGKSKRHERIMDLTVEIDGEIGSLEDALRQFTRSEILDGENKYNCGRCRSYQKARKKLRVLEAPNVLTIALKRFQSGKYGKLNKAVKFPEILNLAKYMSETSDKSPIYQLYGVVVHLDVMNATFSGHYICYLKNNQGRWYKADDSVVQKVDLDNVLSQDAYMLFYSRCSPRAPKSIRKLMAQREHQKRSRDPNHFCKSRSCRDEHPWSIPTSGKLTPQNHHQLLYRPIWLNSGDDSDNSSFFSEAKSYSTDSSNGESTSSTNDNLDQMLGESGTCWTAHSRSISDFDTSSSSSSSSSSSPSSAWSSPHLQHSPLANMDRYSSEAATANVGSKSEPDGFWRRSSCDKCKVNNNSSSINNDRVGSQSGRDKDKVKGVHI